MCPKGHPYTVDNLYRERSGRARCRQCVLDYAREYRDRPGRREKRRSEEHARRNHPDHKDRILSLRRRNLYGLDGIKFTELLECQNHRCLICDKELDGTNELPAVDHDHSCCSGQKTCGKCIRGILCRSCNSGLGYFHDNPDLLIGAAMYVLAFKDKSQSGGE